MDNDSETPLPIASTVEKQSLSKTRLENERIAFEQRVAAAEERRKNREAERAKLEDFTTTAADSKQQTETNNITTPRRDVDDIISERSELEDRIRSLNHELAATNLRTYCSRFDCIALS